jgi:hypothetical protein
LSPAPTPRHRSPWLAVIHSLIDRIKHTQQQHKQPSTTPINQLWSDTTHKHKQREVSIQIKTYVLFLWKIIRRLFKFGCSIYVLTLTDRMN